MRSAPLLLVCGWLLARPWPLPAETILLDDFSTGVNWLQTPGFSVLIDDLRLERSCVSIPPVAIEEPLVAGATWVSVSDVLAGASQVTVRDLKASTVLGVVGAPAAGLVQVPVPALLPGQRIGATQTIDGCESFAVIAEVGDPSSIPQVYPRGVLIAGMQVVGVNGLDVRAEAVSVYADGRLIGRAGPGLIMAAGGVPVEPLVKGQMITATQTICGIEGMRPSSGPVVGSGHNAPVRISLGVRETGITAPIGSDGGTAGPIEWLIPDSPLDPSDGAAVGIVPYGQLVVPSPLWQTVTFDTANAKTANLLNGDGIIQPRFVVLECLGITEVGADTGPYRLYMDNITSAGQTFATFGPPLSAGQQSVFRRPSYSGTSSGHMTAPPDVAEVDAAVGDGAAGALRVEWRYRDEGWQRFIRLTTSGTADLPNPIIDLSVPLTLRVLLQPACHAVWADADGDQDVDQSDFGLLQRCLGVGSGFAAVAPGCGCFDRELPAGVIDSADVTAFSRCASGPGVAAADPPPTGCGS